MTTRKGRGGGCSFGCLFPGFARRFGEPYPTIGDVQGDTLGRGGVMHGLLALVVAGRTADNRPSTVVNNDCTGAVHDGLATRTEHGPPGSVFEEVPGDRPSHHVVQGFWQFRHMFFWLATVDSVSALPPGLQGANREWIQLWRSAMACRRLAAA